MEKPKQIREVLQKCVPLLRQNPDHMMIFVDKGKLVATGAASLSFEYQYELTIIVADFAQNVNTVMVPLLAWIRQYQPELMMNSDKRENAMRFEVEIQNNETCDIEIKLPLTERVKVWKDEQGLHFEHLPEPPEDPYDGITWELFINGEYQPWPPISTD
ncbi:phage tail protein [Aeromonas salmonicida]|uniref:Phage tail protein n=1 Tax=Aeromonas salmonicida TaxID=645 RepID=A0AAX3VS72_AERSA|nr:phage tail protein [Aeromonas salmonicida]WHF36801.1 phage tail protein [Aeromonas salmonicida]